jgi:hypothetical protein
LGHIVRRVQPSIRDSGRNHLTDIRFYDGGLSAVYQINFCLHWIDSNDFMSIGGEASSRHSADVT